jgi:hypothetical protein
MERRPIRVLGPQCCRFIDIAAASAHTGGDIDRVGSIQKAGCSDSLEAVSSNDVAATMALNSIRISG